MKPLRRKPSLSPLGKAIEYYQVMENVSTYRLSMLSGVTEATLSRLKQGITSPTIYTLERVAKALNTSLSNIIIKKESIEELSNEQK